jgi:hypothetical protein
MNCHFINSIDRTPLLFKLNSFLYDAVEGQLEDQLNIKLMPRCNDGLHEAMEKWVMLMYVIGQIDNPDTTCYVVDFDGEQLADFDGQLITCL